MLAVTSALALGTGLLFGLAPALQAARVNLVPALKQTRAGEDRVRRFRLSLSQGLAVVQIGISLLLLVAAGLFVRTLSNLHSIAVGFNRENLLLVSLNARQAGYSEDALMRFYYDLQKRMSAIPGVRSVSSSGYALVSGSMSSTSVRIPGQAEKERSSTAVMSVGPGYLSTMQIPLLLGRDIEERDMSGASKVAVVNELFARTYFGKENPIGRHFNFGSSTLPGDLEIIGVARTARLNSLKQDIPPVAYILYSQHPKRSLGQRVYALRSTGDPLALAGAVRQVVRQADPRIPIINIVTQERQIEQTIGQERTFAMLCTCFAVLALAIACVGLYGMMAYRVARRTNEIGIRMALGAGRRRLVWMVLREVVLISAAGLAIGLPAARSASKLVESFLFKLKPNDPLTLVLAPLTLLAAAIVAGYAPARRASRIDPWAALRDE